MVDGAIIRASAQVDPARAAVFPLGRGRRAAGMQFVVQVNLNKVSGADCR